MLFSHKEIKEWLKLRKCPAILPGNLTCLHGALRYWDQIWPFFSQMFRIWFFWKLCGWQKNGHLAKLFLAYFGIFEICHHNCSLCSVFVLQVVLSLRYSKSSFVYMMINLMIVIIVRKLILIITLILNLSRLNPKRHCSVC